VLPALVLNPRNRFMIARVSDRASACGSSSLPPSSLSASHAAGVDSLNNCLKSPAQRSSRFSALPARHRQIVPLCLARRAAPVAIVLLQQFLQLAHDLGMLAVEIPPLRQILPQVE